MISLYLNQMINSDDTRGAIGSDLLLTLLCFNNYFLCVSKTPTIHYRAQLFSKKLWSHLWGIEVMHLPEQMKTQTKSVALP